MVSDLINRDSVSWDPGKVRQCFDWNSSRNILSMELPSNLKDDFLYWKYHPSGRYSVKTGYYFLSRNQMMNDSPLSTKDERFAKLIWSLNIQPKWKIFLWKLLYDGIAVKVNLVNRGIAVDATCDVCGLELEDSQHLFRFCSLAKYVWDNSPMTVCCDITGFQSLRSWIQHFILLFYSEDGRHSTRIIWFIENLWGLWTARNTKVFKGIGVTTATVVELVNLALKDHEVFNEEDKTRDMGGIEARREPTLPPGFNHVDGSWDKASTRAGIGWAFICPNQADTNDGGGKYGTAFSALQCEAWACLEALKWANRQGKEEVLVLSDSVLLLENLRSNQGKEISIAWLIEDIRVIALNFRKCSIIKVTREQVQRANDIANTCRCTLSNLVL
ncbi:uncharacterized protein LOC110730643 [Chenopodium quinoa]|uniref:uncharacterized protein LOC110730643 n=1 Tax=Chenopodium quinoa TaxID=63459 RepID=UPI000B7724B1|nr:uncharacterized protein LOC110730643 [Chenopodium quinoa]